MPLIIPKLLERVEGIAPSTQPWEGRVLPLNYTRTGADEGTRTHDLCFTKALLYQLSYIGTFLSECDQVRLANYQTKI